MLGIISLILGLQLLNVKKNDLETQGATKENSKHNFNQLFDNIQGATKGKSKK